MHKYNNTLPKFIKNPNPKIYLSDNWTGIDLETTNLDKGDARNKDNRIVLGWRYSNKHGWKEYYTEQDIIDDFQLYYDSDFIIVHGGKFELKWLRRLGCALEKLLLFDTLLAEYVIAGNRDWELSLDSVAKRYGGVGKNHVVSSLISSGICPSNIPRSLLSSYCRQDVAEIIYVCLRQRKYLAENDLLSVFFIRCISTPVISDIEMNGMALDEELVLKTHSELCERHWEVKEQIKELSGGIVPSGAVQKAHFLYGTLGFEVTARGKPHKQFPEGLPKTDEGTISKLKPKTEIQRKYLELCSEESELKKKISTYTLRFLKAGKILYGDINQSISHSHRLTSSNPNLQNIDRTLKKLISTRQEGWNVRSADYKTLEMTVAGMMAQDKQCLLDIKNKHDFHSYTASIVHDTEWIKAGSSKKTVEGDRVRTNSKEHTFKPLYGGTSGTPKQKAYYKAFKERYPEITSMQKTWINEVLKTKQLRTVTGLIFYWPDTEYTSTGYIINTSKICNYPVQMFATADISPTGTCLLWHYLKANKLQSFIVNEVHDSVILEEHPDEKEILGNLLEFCLSKDVIRFFKEVINYDINYPLEIEQKSTNHWDYNL